MPAQSTRRGLVRGIAISAASWSRILGANDRIQIGVIGCGSRGALLMREFQRHSEVALGAVCDVYETRAKRVAANAPGVRVLRDYRALIESRPLDAVVIATPNHWHEEPCLAALSSGLDVYVEKPLSYAIDEGPRMVKAARINARICQVGMQQRSGSHYLRAKQEYIDAGKLGKVSYVRTWWHGNNYFLVRAPESMRTKPADLDWAAFLGRLKWRDWDPLQYLSWRSYLDFGGGQITDLFTHWVDVVHMFLGSDIPVSAAAAGGVYNFNDGRTAPDTVNVLEEYPARFTVTFEGVLGTAATQGAVEFFGTEGSLAINREGYEFRAADRKAPPVVVQAEPYDITRDHVNDFLDALRTRRLPNGDVLLGHRSAQAAHLAHMAWLRRRQLHFDPVREEILPG
jgi:predicted dehydrogenase